MATIDPQIVIVQATVTQAPTPSTLQQQGAIISVGGTTQAVSASTYCTSVAAVQALLSTGGNHAEVLNMATTFFAQGTAIGLSVLELGVNGGVAATQITALQTWITANSSPQQFYAYLTPATWDTTTSAALNTMAGNYSSSTGKTYFFVTTSLANLPNYTNKSIYATIPSPTAAGTEFQSAVSFYEWIANNPSPAAPSPPMDLRYAFGVTPWADNSSSLPTILGDFGNYIGTGAEGGISNDIIRNGTTMDGNQAMFWYAVDWVLVNCKLNLANALIAATNSTNPIYYNQFGINRLLGVIKQIITTGISDGLLLEGTPSAIPFATYVTANPGDYKTGVYKGFSATVTPQNGMSQITFFLNATQFVA